MSSLWITLTVGIVLLSVALLGLGIGFLITGKNRFRYPKLTSKDSSSPHNSARDSEIGS